MQPLLINQIFYLTSADRSAQSPPPSHQHSPCTNTSNYSAPKNPQDSNIYSAIPSNKIQFSVNIFFLTRYNLTLNNLPQILSDLFYRREVPAGITYNMKNKISMLDKWIFCNFTHENVEIMGSALYSSVLRIRILPDPNY